VENFVLKTGFLDMDEKRILVGKPTEASDLQCDQKINGSQPNINA